MCCSCPYRKAFTHASLMLSCLQCRVMSSGAVFCQLSTLKSIVTLTVRVQYADYHSTTLTPPQNIRVVRVSAYVRVTLTYADTLTRGRGEGGNPCTVRVLSELL